MDWIYNPKVAAVKLKDLFGLILERAGGRGGREFVKMQLLPRVFGMRRGRLLWTIHIIWRALSGDGSRPYKNPGPHRDDRWPKCLKDHGLLAYQKNPFSMRSQHQARYSKSKTGVLRYSFKYCIFTPVSEFLYFFQRTINFPNNF